MTITEGGIYLPHSHESVLLPSDTAMISLVSSRLHRQILEEKGRERGREKVRGREKGGREGGGEREGEGRG